MPSSPRKSSILPRITMQSSSQVSLPRHSSSGCSNGCLIYQPKTTLTPIDVTTRLASTEGISSSEASSIRREIDAALKDLKGFDAQISLLRRSIITLQNQRAAMEECIADSKSLLSPIRRLPMEMITQIFSYCCAQNRVTVGLEGEKNVTIDAPAMSLMQVCRSWHSTVTSTKALWATIRLGIASEMDDKDSERVQAAISRLLYASEQTPLDVTIKTVSVQEGLHSSVHSLISESKRWKAASLVFRHSNGDQLWQGLKDNLPILERLRLKLGYHGRSHEYDMFADAPRLRNIALRDLEPGSSVSLPYSQMKVVRLMFVYLGDTLDILHQASSLEHLTLYDPPWESDATVHAFPATYFRMIWKRCPSNHVRNLIARLSFPALEEFHLDDRKVDESAEDKFQVGKELLSHLAPSSKTLHTLTLERVTIHSNDLVNLFIMLPQVKTLHLLKMSTSADQGVTPEVIRRLHGYGNGGAQRVLIPKLSNLEIDITSGKGGATFSDLFNMVKSRLDGNFVGLKKVSLWIRNEVLDEALVRADVLDLAMGGTVMTVRDSDGFVDYT